MDFPSFIELFERLDAGDFWFVFTAPNKASLLFNGPYKASDELFGPQSLALASQALAWAGAPWLADDSEKQERSHAAAVPGGDGWVFRIHASKDKDSGTVELAIRKLNSSASVHRPASLPIAERHAWAWAKHDAKQLARAAPESDATPALGATRRL